LRTGDQPIPVLVLDVTAEEADKLLATFDPIGAMATAMRRNWKHSFRRSVAAMTP
jgi:hypothetical protein